MSSKTNKRSSSVNFYNSFHSTSTKATKIINEKNFTYRILLRQLKPFYSQRHPLKILDYGCGVGTLSNFLASKGHKVTGIDISTKSILIAKESSQNLDLETIYYTLSEWNKRKPHEVYDLILCTEVIEHIEDDKRLLEKLHQYTHKGGHLIVSTPSENSPLYRLGLLEKFDQRVGHLRRYSESKLTNLINTTGYTVKRVYKAEGIIRNSLYTFPPMGQIIRFLKGPFSDIATFLDNVSLLLGGESNLIVLAVKK